MVIYKAMAMLMTTMMFGVLGCFDGVFVETCYRGVLEMDCL